MKSQILIGLRSVDTLGAVWNQIWSPEDFGSILEFENLGPVQTDGWDFWGGHQEYQTRRQHGE